MITGCCISTLSTVNATALCEGRTNHGHDASATANSHPQRPTAVLRAALVEAQPDRLPSLLVTLQTPFELAMDLRQARRLLELPEDGGPLTAEALRKQYLRLALRTHPDKNPGDASAAERFADLGAAHTALLAAVAQGAAAAREHERAAALLDLLLRAVQGEDVSNELAALGEYRPPAEFGVDLSVRFDSRVLAADSCDECGHRPPTDVRQAFRELFREEGLTEEGDPIGGYELPPIREV